MQEATTEPRLNDREGQKPARLTEEDVIPGRPWTHPDTKLEYEDWAAYFAGKDPIPHWRNARVKEITGVYGAHQQFTRVFDEIFEHFDRQGTPITEEGHRRLDGSRQYGFKVWW